MIEKGKKLTLSCIRCLTRCEFFFFFFISSVLLLQRTRAGCFGLYLVGKGRRSVVSSATLRFFFPPGVGRGKCFLAYVLHLFRCFFIRVYPPPFLLPLTLNNCIVQMGYNFSHRKFGLPSPGKASCDRIGIPNIRCMLCVLVFP